MDARGAHHVAMVSVRVHHAQVLPTHRVQQERDDEEGVVLLHQTDGGAENRRRGTHRAPRRDVGRHEPSRDDKWMKSEPARVLEGNTYRGTAFEWDITGLMMVQMIVTCVPVLATMGFSAGPMAAPSAPPRSPTPCVELSHPAMHGLNEVPLERGVPSLALANLRDSKYYDYLYLNHAGHHVLSGQCNYNAAAARRPPPRHVRRTGGMDDQDSRRFR